MITSLFPFTHARLAADYDASTLCDRRSFPCDRKPEPTWRNGYNSFPNSPPGFDCESRSASENVNFEHPQSSNCSDRQEEYRLDMHRTTTSEPRCGQSKERQQHASSSCEGGSGQQNLQELVDALHLMTSQINRSQTHALPQNMEDLFDGDPLRYRRFIHHFDSHTARGIVDMAVQLDLLISSCTGEARKNIEDCVMVSTPELGYLEARKILETWYGQEHSIVNAYVRKLTGGPPLRPNNAGALSQLARDMKNCEMSCAGMSSAGLDTKHTVASIFKRLPRYMQDKFMATVSSQLHAGHPILFSQLSQFV